MKRVLHVYVVIIRTLHRRHGAGRALTATSRDWWLGQVRVSCVSDRHLADDRSANCRRRGIVGRHNCISCGDTALQWGHGLMPEYDDDEIVKCSGFVCMDYLIITANSSDLY